MLGIACVVTPWAMRLANGMRRAPREDEPWSSAVVQLLPGNTAGVYHSGLGCADCQRGKQIRGWRSGAPLTLAAAGDHVAGRAGAGAVRGALADLHALDLPTPALEDLHRLAGLAVRQQLHDRVRGAVGSGIHLVGDAERRGGGGRGGEQRDQQGGDSAAEAHRRAAGLNGGGCSSCVQQQRCGSAAAASL